MRRAQFGMLNREVTTSGPDKCVGKHRLPARVFYGVIVAGLLVGAVASAAAGWVYLESGDRKPTSRRIWDAEAASFVIPICVLVGATFGGLAGVAAAIGMEWAGSGDPGA